MKDELTLSELMDLMQVTYIAVRNAITLSDTAKSELERSAAEKTLANVRRLHQRLLEVSNSRMGELINENN